MEKIEAETVANEIESHFGGDFDKVIWFWSVLEASEMREWMTITDLAYLFMEGMIGNKEEILDHKSHVEAIEERFDWAVEIDPEFQVIPRYREELKLFEVDG